MHTTEPDHHVRRLVADVGQALLITGAWGRFGTRKAIAESEIVVDGGAATYHAVIDPFASDEWAAVW